MKSSYDLFSFKTISKLNFKDELSSETSAFNKVETLQYLKI